MWCFNSTVQILNLELLMHPVEIGFGKMSQNPLEQS